MGGGTLIDCRKHQVQNGSEGKYQSEDRHDSLAAADQADRCGKDTDKCKNRGNPVLTVYRCNLCTAGGTEDYNDMHTRFAGGSKELTTGTCGGETLSFVSTGVDADRYLLIAVSVAVFCQIVPGHCSDSRTFVGLTCSGSQGLFGKLVAFV